MHKTYRNNNNTTTSRRVRIGVAWILLTSTANTIMAGSVSAFSLASIFPRKTEKFHKSDEIIKTIHDSDNVLNDQQQHWKQVNGNILVSQEIVGMEEQMPHFNANGFHQQDASNNSPIHDGQSPHQDSVHLQLNSMSSTTATASRPDDTQVVDKREDGDIETTEQGSPPPEQKKPTQVRVHAYVDPNTNQHWVALNSSRRKFLAFLEYNNVSPAETVKGKTSITTTTLSLPEPGRESNENSEAGSGASTTEVECVIRKEWRELWKARRLLTDRTELLAVYQSDQNNDQTTAASDDSQSKKPKRGGFSDLLNLYTHRLVAILSDEQHDERTPPDERHRSSLVRPQQRNRFGQPLTDENISYQTDHRILIKWLEDNYGMSETLMLQARRFRTLPVPAQLELMNHFMDWFRGHFPYYYDRCDACGASQKDELAAAHSQDVDNTNHKEDDHEDSNDDDDDNATFLGYIFPSEVELKGKASRTELYHCHQCGSFTRFPRFNSAFDIIQSQRGRCGEYSLLLYRFLRALNHDARWVVDWADHVWAEVLIGDSNSKKTHTSVAHANGESTIDTSERWVHLDPCEAAVDQPLLYESWGKKQTYIVALYAPLRYEAMRLQNKSTFSFLESLTNPNGAHGHDVAKASLVEDVTQQYTSDSWEDICKRRDEAEDEVESAIEDAIEDLQNRLLT